MASSRKTPAAAEPQFSRAGLKDMRKFLARQLSYETDRLSSEARVEICDALAAADAALTSRNTQQGVESSIMIQKVIEKYFPRPKDAAWRENVEVLLVAFVLAFAIRTYFLQPFQIPTASMQPTLYGIEVQDENIPAAQYPGALRQIWDKFILGKSYVRIIAPADGSLNSVNLQIRETNLFLYWLTFSTVTVDGRKQTVWMPRDYIIKALDKTARRNFKKGDTIVSASVQTGDFVFVDKITYHFRAPERGDVFVFFTYNIHDITTDQRKRGVMGAEYYIKRLSAQGGDRVQIIPPYLYVNGDVARFNPMYEKIYSMENRYTGYVLLPNNTILAEESDIYQLPPRSYFALGDNSPNSWDSRGWGPVPEENIVGKAFIVFYPFGSRWGLIH
ncbi:signal peptidase I [Kamptonema cortianum]|nr:signal peptidase I [Oscillatoria laete-virens]MDK3159648.1 signal peptidase I [Kamptonema cortianum]MDL5050294.1 signal peptidase I [Oscillatoria amoena NRMC-F 0135]MDL5055127.1 signal peptidase I [Oscillatoria laete-virens NRMC-F 0139]